MNPKNHHAAGLFAGLMLGAGALLSTGCSSCPSRCDDHASTPRRVATISHVVLVNLSDPTQADAVMDDARRRLASIPGVVSFSVGGHIETGRATVMSDYDVGMIIGFDTTAAYAGYVEHPDHVAFVDRWKAGITGLRIWDIHDPE